jgi:alkanesulfonate monooxygenase SsuD/methylene tetrahydromethanopterin reductase-like flavin-dependent oxidoreductase (luciferase family)
LIALARDEADARLRGEIVAGYLRTGAMVRTPFKNPPGYLSIDDNVRLLRGFTAERSFTKDKRVIDMRTGSVQDLIDAAVMFCGTPDQVCAQIVDFIEYTGGLGNLLCMTQAGHLSHADTVDNLTLLANEVMPRLKAYKQPEPAATAA